MKEALGCNFQTSNDMARADTGTRPLINALIKKYISYIKSLHSRKSALCYDSIVYETGNSETPNFCKFNENFNLDISDLILKSKEEINKTCDGNYDRTWSTKISQSTKAVSFNKFKSSKSWKNILL